MFFSRKRKKSMWTKKNVIIFFAGAEAFHTLSHILLPRFVQLPMMFGNFLYTQQWNIGAIVFNGIVTVALLWWASKEK